MQEQKALGMRPRRKLSPAGRILEALRVGICMLTICAISILGMSIVLWAFVFALSPRHQALEAFLVVAQFARIPFGLALGLSAFFSAVTWDTARVRIDSFETLADRRQFATKARERFHRRREVS